MRCMISFWIPSLFSHQERLKKPSEPVIHKDLWERAQDCTSFRRNILSLKTVPSWPWRRNIKSLQQQLRSRCLPRATVLAAGASVVLQLYFWSGNKSSGSILKRFPSRLTAQLNTSNIWKPSDKTITYILYSTWRVSNQIPLVQPKVSTLNQDMSFNAWEPMLYLSKVVDFSTTPKQLKFYSLFQ